MIAEQDALNYAVFASVRATDLRIALSNLLNNAVESLPDGRGQVTVTCHASGEQVQITVADTGCGISHDLLPQLGQRGVTFGKKGGSGIGLSNAREAVEKCGGSLSITSELEHGTQVTLKIPRAPAPRWFLDELQIATGGTDVPA
ncbi:ATP-binding protein [Bdellovibrionota bacterium FG-1]